MYEVTIGIPVYNAEKYLPQTIKSALNQTFKSIEFLIIDDCGTDNSIAYIHSLQEEHPRGKDIRIVHHQNNQGISAARNTILKESKGNYLFYLDSDDLITADCIEKLYDITREEKAEVTYASYCEKWENSENGVNFILPHKIFNKIDKLASFANQNLHQTLRSFVWNTLYDLSFLRQNKLEFKPVKIWEDLLFYYDIIPLVSKAVLLPDITYTYFKRSGSLSQYNYRETIPLQEIKDHITIREFCKSKCLELIEKPYFANLLTKTMKICTDTAVVAVDKRKMFTPPLPASYIKRVLRHPLKPHQIIKMSSYKFLNLSIYFIGKSPYWLIFFILSAYRTIIKKYRK